MATSIKSTSLDFETIKDSLKTFLEQKDQFSDYDFAASGINNILDVLAYNTHYNALTANFALNESFLNTAQLRSSVISHAEGIGYIPKSRTASRAIIKLSLDLSEAVARPSIISINPGVAFSTVVDGKTYTFQTTETLIGSDNGSGLYFLSTIDGSTDIPIFEGQFKSKRFIADDPTQNSLYVIPDAKMDKDTVIIRVYDSEATTAFSTYEDIKNVIAITNETRLYILKEAPNNYYELAFADGTTLGQSPQAGDQIVVEYLSCSGPEANRAEVFTPISTYSYDGNTYDFSAITVIESVGGDYIESIESVRKNAPFQYAAQNRMVTSKDYSSLILRNFSTYISDIQSYGGEEALLPEYGAIYISIVFEDDVTTELKEITRNSILDLVDQLSVVSFNVRFVDPIITYIETSTYFQINPKLSTLSINTITDEVNATIQNYFEESTGKFGQSFRRSNLLTRIDNVSAAVLSSRMDIKVQQRITPVFDKAVDYTLRYPVPLSTPDEKDYIVTSSLFNIGSATCRIRNKLSSTKLEVVNIQDQSIVIDNAGSYEPSTAKINIVGLTPTGIVGENTYIAISATPANQSAVAPTREDIIKFDSNISFSSPVITTDT